MWVQLHDDGHIRLAHTLCCQGVPRTAAFASGWMPQLGPSSSATTVSLFSLLITAYTGTQSAAARPSSGGSNVANVFSPAACSAVKQGVLTGMIPAADVVCAPHAAGCPSLRGSARGCEAHDAHAALPGEESTNPTRSNPQSAAGIAGTQAVMTRCCPPCVPTPNDTAPVLAVCAQGALREGWSDKSHGPDLHSSKWRSASKVRPLLDDHVQHTGLAHVLQHSQRPHQAV
jgi:hypothetical protein